MITYFKTIEAEGFGEYKEKGSKFLGHAYHIVNENEAIFFINDLRKKHPKANHVCYAYILGEKGEAYKANDDGEPGHSAGTPIYNTIRSEKLTFVLVAVVRIERHGPHDDRLDGRIGHHGGDARVRLRRPDVEGTGERGRRCRVLGVGAPHAEDIGVTHAAPSQHVKPGVEAGTDEAYAKSGVGHGRKRSRRW